MLQEKDEYSLSIFSSSLYCLLKIGCYQLLCTNVEPLTVIRKTLLLFSKETSSFNFLYLTCLLSRVCRELVDRNIKGTRLK